MPGLTIKDGGMTAMEEPQGADRREHTRYPLMLAGKLYRQDGSEFSCVTENASAGGFEIIVGAAAMRKIALGAKLTIAIHHLDRIEVEVMRTTPRGFGCRILRTSLGREAFLGQMNWLVKAQSGGANDMGGGTVDQRRHPRFVPDHKQTTVQLRGRQPVDATLIDVSQSGAAVRTDVKAGIGTKVLIGRRPSVVVRLVPGGFAVKFDVPLDPPTAKAQAPTVGAPADPLAYV